MNNKHIDKALLKAVDFAFDSLGKSCNRALYFHLRTGFRLKKKEIPDRVEEFDNALRLIFKSGAVFIERLILKKLCEEVGQEFGEESAFDFVEAVSRVKSAVLDKESLSVQIFVKEVVTLKENEEQGKKISR